MDFWNIAAIAASAALVLGCSSSDAGATAPRDGGTGDSGDNLDAGDASDAADASDAPDNACGDAPWVHVQVGVYSYVTKQPIAGARGTLDLCPTVPLVTDATGTFDIYITKDAPTDTRVEADGFITMRGGASAFSADQNLGATPLFPSAVAASWFPHLSPTAPVLLAESFVGPGVKPDAGDPCTTRDGIVYAVKGHPEATIIYYGGTPAAPVPDPTLQATTTVGAAEISGLAATPPGSYVEVTATKGSCTNISFVSYPHLGRYVLENGVLTVAGAFMPPLASP